MKLKTSLLFAVTGLLLFTCLENGAHAQWRGVRQPGQKVLRLLGAGFGPGYHWQNPGHDSSYYNPYSANNSLLISKQFPNDANSQYGSGNLPSQGIPYSQYAPTGSANGQFGTLPGATIGGDFQPVPKSKDSGMTEADEQNNESSGDVNNDSESKESSKADRSDESAFLNLGPAPKSFQPARYSRPAETSPTTIAPKLNSPWSLSDPFADQ